MLFHYDWISIPLVYTQVSTHTPRGLPEPRSQLLPSHNGRGAPQPPSCTPMGSTLPPFLKALYSPIESGAGAGTAAGVQPRRDVQERGVVEQRGLASSP